jgi:hypothetical protein
MNEKVNKIFEQFKDRINIVSIEDKEGITRCIYQKLNQLNVLANDKQETFKY